MRRLFKKDPPPGWTPTPRAFVVPKPPPNVRLGVTMDEAQMRLQQIEEATRRKAAFLGRTDSRTASANGPTDSIPWTAAAIRHDDGSITLRDAHGNEQHISRRDLEEG